MLKQILLENIESIFDNVLLGNSNAYLSLARDDIIDIYTSFCEKMSQMFGISRDIQLIWTQGKNSQRFRGYKEKSTTRTVSIDRDDRSYRIIFCIDLEDSSFFEKWDICRILIHELATRSMSSDHFEKES